MNVFSHNSAGQKSKIRVDTWGGSSSWFVNGCLLAVLSHGLSSVFTEEKRQRERE